MNFKTLTLKQFLVFWLLICFALSYLAQLKYDTWYRYSSSKINASYNEYIEPQPLSSDAAKMAAFGANEFVADVYWLELIQYYGGGDPYGKYRKLAEMFNTVTDLSPKFLEAYQTGLIILPGEGFVDQAIQLGEKGQQNIPDSWEMPYYEGLVYHIYKKDYVSAAHQFELAAAKPGAPANAKYFAAIYYKQADQRETAYEIFKMVRDTTKEDYIRERAQKYVTHLEIIFFLEKAVSMYKDKYGSYPSSLDKLVSGKIVTGIPDSPLNIRFGIDSKSGAILELKD